MAYLKGIRPLPTNTISTKFPPDDIKYPNMYGFKSPGKSYKRIPIDENYPPRPREGNNYWLGEVKYGSTRRNPWEKAMKSFDFKSASEMRGISMLSSCAHTFDMRDTYGQSTGTVILGKLYHTKEKKKFIKIKSSYGVSIEFVDYDIPKEIKLDASKLPKTIKVDIGENKNMGIGKLGDTKIQFRPKFRWTYEGYDKDGNVVFEKIFVKVAARPNLKIEEIEIPNPENPETKTWIPGKAEWDLVHITVYDIEEKEVSNLKIQNMSSGKIELYDGCGTIMETWTLKGIDEVDNQKVEKIVSDLDYSGETTTVEIKIPYKDVEFNYNNTGPHSH